MSVTEESLAGWLTSPEGERLEFKEARRSFAMNDLHRYLVALANEGGGHLVLGVSDTMPRRIVGTAALTDFAKHAHELTRQLGLRVTFTELNPPAGRVLVAAISSRHRGQPVSYNGQFLMRVGESVVAMTPDQLRGIFAEAVTDPSALPVDRSTFQDLDPAAIAVFQGLWAGKAERVLGIARGEEIRALAPEEIVERSSLMSDEGITTAALVLLGSEKALQRFLPNHEIIYEYRDRVGEVQARTRHNLRNAFVLIHDELWGLVDARNVVTEIPAGLLRTSIKAFNERTVREGVMNAVAHRDYARPESVFLRHDPQQLIIESPGGFPPTVTAENVLDRQVPRNRLIAESLERAGFVERSGQGADIMFREAVRDAKPLPSFEGTDDTRVVLTLSSVIRDPEFVRAIDAIARDKLEVLDARDFILIDHIARDDKVPKGLLQRATRLVDIGVLERRPRKRFALSSRLYAAAGRKGAYTRATGLERKAKVELTHQHLREAGEGGAPIGEIMDIFPDLSRNQVFGLLTKLRDDGRAHVKGEKRFARWYAGKRE